MSSIPSNVDAKTNSSASAADGKLGVNPGKKRPPKRVRPNYAQIHSRPLPLETFPLPAFSLSNPLSLVQLVYCYITRYISPPRSDAPGDCLGYFSSESRSIHVTDPKHARKLWEMGFFGKGSLSRSEPSWMTREEARVKAEKSRRGGGTAEEVTGARREERRMFKLERARLEREKIERQRALEAGVELVPSDEKSTEDSFVDDAGSQVKKSEVSGDSDLGVSESAVTPTRQNPAKPSSDAEGTSDAIENLPEIKDQEHLQLTLEEAFFLYYGLNALSLRIVEDGRSRPITSSIEAMNLFQQHALYPPTPSLPVMGPDNPFLLNYVVYHHFRSLGWVVRSGVKFSVDYLLYNRGPVFSHAEFAILIVPSYSHSYWHSDEGRKQRRIPKSSDWWWLHCVNRVQSQVRKTLVLVYVHIPAPRSDPGSDVDIGRLLRGYKIREVVLRRWVANRSRD